MGEEQGKVLHIAMFPWLAIGHLRPFFNLSICLAQKGHIISFISTPKNLQRIPKIPKNLLDLINLISFPMPEVENLEPQAESSTDVPHFKQQLLKIAFDLLEPAMRSFLENANPKPDWVVYDFASHWLPKLAEEIGISKAFLALYPAALMAFLGPPSELVSEHRRSTAEDFTFVPDWIPFPSNMAFRLHEMSINIEKDADVGNEYDSGTSESMRFGLCIGGSDIVIIRSCIKFEPEWFDLIPQLYKKPVIPVGILLVEDEDDENKDNSEWVRITKFLDLQNENSVVYVALGTEATLSQKDVHELALGLEQCGLPFLWVLNRNLLLDMLPSGFYDRVRGKGMVYAKWAPQLKILSHRAVGGFLTHCGWGSATEGLRFGRVLILFPIMNDQGLNARLLEGKKVGVEISRNEKDGSFTSREVVDAVVMAMVGEDGRKVRENARKMEELFGDKSRNNDYIDGLLHHMEQIMPRTSNKDGLEISP